jgi:hypothetical protein
MGRIEKRARGCDWRQAEDPAGEPRPTDFFLLLLASSSATYTRHLFQDDDPNRPCPAVTSTVRFFIFILP